jgi:hypothetical protein
MKKDKKSAIKFSEFITKNEYQELFKQFQERKGYMTKLYDKFSDNKSAILGYLVRAEIPGFKDFIAVSAVGPKDDKSSQRFIKAVAINKVLTAGERVLKHFIKAGGKLENWKSMSITDFMDSVDHQKTRFNEEYVQKYAELIDYIKAFENKIKKYYNNENIKIVVIK